MSLSATRDFRPSRPTGFAARRARRRERFRCAGCVAPRRTGVQPARLACATSASLWRVHWALGPRMQSVFSVATRRRDASKRATYGSPRRCAKDVLDETAARMVGYGDCMVGGDRRARPSGWRPVRNHGIRGWTRFVAGRTGKRHAVLIGRKILTTRSSTDDSRRGTVVRGGRPAGDVGACAS